LGSSPLPTTLDCRDIDAAFVVIDSAGAEAGLRLFRERARAQSSGQAAHQRRSSSDCGEPRKAPRATNGATSLALRWIVARRAGSLAIAGKTNGRTRYRLAMRSLHAVRFLLLVLLLCHGATPWCAPTHWNADASQM